TGFRLNILDVVTSIVGFLPATRWREVHLLFPNRRGRQSAARAGFMSEMLTGFQRIKDFPAGL
ncbi:hypothetical protein C4L80_003996, partial [Salmonella enterica subsp. enterica serovar Saintpaul]|nr:hypothetical protein [Salmonella enterica subsp. enterica serovar Saintpaul]